jgi:hypothetical protein
MRNPFGRITMKKVAMASAVAVVAAGSVVAFAYFTATGTGTPARARPARRATGVLPPPLRAPPSFPRSRLSAPDQARQSAIRSRTPTQGLRIWRRP